MCYCICLFSVVEDDIVTSPRIRDVTV